MGHFKRCPRCGGEVGWHFAGIAHDNRSAQIRCKECGYGTGIYNMKVFPMSRVEEDWYTICGK